MIAARQLVADAHDARTAGAPAPSPGPEDGTLRAGLAVLAVAAAWTDRRRSSRRPTAPGRRTSGSPPPPTAARRPTPSTASRSSPPRRSPSRCPSTPNRTGLTPYFSRFGGVASYEDHPLVFTADYHDADGNGFTLWLHSVDPRGLDGYFQPERPGDHDITETGTVSIDGSAAEFARGALDTGSSFANLRWERPDGRWVQILGDGSYAETSAVVAVAESLVDRPRPLGLQFGLAPAGWSLSGYEESRSIDLTRDDDSGQLLRAQCDPARGRRDARERVRRRGADGRPGRDGDGPGAGGPAGAQGRR